MSIPQVLEIVISEPYKKKVGRPRIHDNPKQAKLQYDIKYNKERYNKDPKFREKEKERSKINYLKRKERLKAENNK